MVLCPKCGRMTFVPYDRSRRTWRAVPHCGNEIQKPAPKENVMPDMLIDPEAEVVCGRRGGVCATRNGAGHGHGQATCRRKRRLVRNCQARRRNQQMMSLGKRRRRELCGGEMESPGNRSTKTGRRKRNPAMELVEDGCRRNCGIGDWVTEILRMDSKSIRSTWRTICRRWLCRIR